MGNWSISKGLNREKSIIKQSENVKKTVHVNVKENKKVKWPQRF